MLSNFTISASVCKGEKKKYHHVALLNNLCLQTENLLSYLTATKVLSLQLGSCHIKITTPHPRTGSQNTNDVNSLEGRMQQPERQGTLLVVMPKHCCMNIP